MAFVPCDLVSIQVGRLYASVYPKVEPTMPIHERAHAFQVIKSALKSLPLDMRLILEAIGTQLNCNAQVDGAMFDFCSMFDKSWYNFANLVIQSFHNSAGAVIQNTMIAGNPAVLLAVANGPLPACCQQDVCYVHVSCTINFARLITIPGPTVLRVGFYIKLPQTTRVMVNGLGANYNLTSWLSADDLSVLTRNEGRAQILEPCLCDGLITLAAADFNLAEANVDGETIHDTIQTKILKLGFKQICASIFQQLCPGYSDQPHAALEHIRQLAPGPDGQMVTASVIEYYQCMMNAARPFATKHTYAISVCDRFIEGLDRRLVPCFRCMYQAHSTFHNLNGAYQRAQLPIILTAAQAAEDEVKGVQEIRGLLGQGFYSNVIGNDATAYPSQAEKTLSCYSGRRSDDRDCGRDRAQSKKECFGCGGNHSWMADKKIMCLCRTDPAGIKRASENYKKYLEKIKEMRAKRSKNRVVDFKDMAPSDQKRMRKAVLAIQSNDLQASLITASTSSSLPGPVIYMIQVPPDATLLKMAAPARRILPVPIQPSFPHIILQLGQVLGCLKCPAIHCVIDTAAAINSGNLHYYAAIAKAFPHTVAAIFSAADHKPIILSGIVQQGGASVTTNLTVAFQFHMPYLTHKGHPTSFLVACGPNVMVNTILGLPFIQATRMVLDASDQVVELRALDTPPFALDFCHAMCTLPPVSSPPDAGTATRYADIIKEVNRIEALYSTDPAATATDDGKPASTLRSSKRSKGIDFNSAFSNDGSVITIGSMIKPRLSDDTDVSNCYDVHNSV